MESKHLLLHANWGLEPGRSQRRLRSRTRDDQEKEEDSRVFAFRFPRSALPPRFMGSKHLLLHANWGHELTRKRPLTPSPSPIGWERVAARPGEGGFMGSLH